jgi:ribosome assembly protein YihI (activator of Der GTPase)
LAHSKLASERQERLDELLARQDAGALSDDEAKELDRLLDQIDQLNILKARALLTLRERNQSSDIHFSEG